MPTQALAAYGTTLSWNGTEVAELQNISGPSQQMKTVDASEMDGPNNKFIPSSVNGGQITIDGNVSNDAGQAGLRADFLARTPRTLVITLPITHDTWTATAYCIGLEEDHKVADRIAFKATFQVSGRPLYIPGFLIQQVTQMAQVVSTPFTGPVRANLTQASLVASLSNPAHAAVTQVAMVAVQNV